MTERIKPRLLWIGDAACDTGFARVTHNVLNVLREWWDIHCLGINYMGGPHPYPYPIYPSRMRGDLWGLNFFAELLHDLRPDAVCAIQDPWIIAQFMQFQRGDIPMAAYMPVDAKNQAPGYAEALERLDLAIFYTKFGEMEYRKVGYKGPSAVIPHGVNTEIYRPIDRDEARARIQIKGTLPDNAYIIGNVNRNQPRKRLDLTIEVFSEWLRRLAGCPRKVTNAYLYLHCSQQDAMGWNLAQLAWHYGLAERLIIPDESAVRPDKGLPEAAMPYVYSAFDVQISTTVGEGWGLCVSEGMACGIPQIVPFFSALAEWPVGAAWLIHCPDRQAHVGVHTIGAVPDKEECIRALDLFYRQPRLRAEYAARALARAREPQFQWEAIGRRFHDVLFKMMEKKRQSVQEEKQAEYAKVQEAGRVPKIGASRNGDPATIGNAAN